jgi:hypothetical protein
MGRERVTITDYKTSDVRDPAKARQRARDSLQLQIYAMGYEAMTGRLPDQVALHFLDSGLVGRVDVDPKRVAKARARISEVATGIREERFEATPTRWSAPLPVPRHLPVERRPRSVGARPGVSRPDHDGRDDTLDSLVMEARDRLTNLAVLAAAAVVWVPRRPARDDPRSGHGTGGRVPRGGADRAGRRSDAHADHVAGRVRAPPPDRLPRRLGPCGATRLDGSA